MIDAIEKNLKRGINLLENISDEQYSNTTVPPYFSSIGSNMRHILDVFSCVFNGIEARQIDFSKRARDKPSEQLTSAGIVYFNRVISRLQDFRDADFNMIVAVTDDHGNGRITANYTLGGALAQAHSHAIHHFASVGFVISQLGIELPDEDFGTNPTSPKNVVNF